jgi:hypothetical protein
MLQLTASATVGKQRADEAHDGLVVWEDTDEVGSGLHLAFMHSIGMIERRLARCSLGKVMYASRTRD